MITTNDKDKEKVNNQKLKGIRESENSLNHDVFKVVVDNGKPSESIVTGERKLKELLEYHFYMMRSLFEYPHYDLSVFRVLKGVEVDITESEYLNTLIDEILKGGL